MQPRHRTGQDRKGQDATYQAQLLPALFYPVTQQGDQKSFYDPLVGLLGKTM